MAVGGIQVAGQGDETSIFEGRVDWLGCCWFRSPYAWGFHRRQVKAKFPAGLSSHERSVKQFSLHQR